MTDKPIFSSQNKISSHIKRVSDIEQEILFVIRSFETPSFFDSNFFYRKEYRREFGNNSNFQMKVQ